MSAGKNFVFITPVRNRGEGARSRFECFVRLDERFEDDGFVRGEVVDEYQCEASPFELERRFIRTVHRALPDERGRLVAVIPERSSS